MEKFENMSLWNASLVGVFSSAKLKIPSKYRKFFKIPFSKISQNFHFQVEDNSQ